MPSSIDVRASDIAARADERSIRDKVRAYIIDSLLLGAADTIEDDVSLLESGILDSTGAMELVAFLEDQFALSVENEDLTPENLDSVDRICRFVLREHAEHR
jgi:acyl carrier protein